MIYFWLVVLFFLILMALILALNTFSMARLSRQDGDLDAEPFVSVLIPARNESDKIQQTVRAILAQEYRNFELILLDDQSADGTLDRARRAANGDERFSAVRGEPLPKGWLGKNWACHQLAGKARGDVLVFTDADVRWRPGMLRAMLMAMQKSGAGMLTVWPQQEALSWGERLTVPLLAFSILCYLPDLAVRYIPWKVFAAAVGQCLAFTREGYEKIGGHEAIKDRIMDDMAMAWNAKRKRVRLAGALGEGMLSARMYHNWPEARDGFARTMLQGHGDSVFMLGLSTLFHWLVFVLPGLWLVFGWAFAPVSPWWPWLPLLMTLLGLGMRGWSARLSGQRVVDALLMPVSVYLMTLIAWRSVQMRRTGVINWKGRNVLEKG